MIILDTNVVSELMRYRPNPRVTAWANAQSSGRLYVATPTIFEIEFGIAKTKKAAHKAMLSDGWSTVRDRGLQDRILPVSEAAARFGAQIKAGLTGTRNHADALDCMIAGIAVAEGAIIATRNLTHFPPDRVKIVDPWKYGVPGD